MIELQVSKGIEASLGNIWVCRLLRIIWHSYDMVKHHGFSVKLIRCYTFKMQEALSLYYSTATYNTTATA